jgi:hypothetical protein
LGFGGLLGKKTMQLLKKHIPLLIQLIVEKWNTPILIFQGGKDFQYQLDKVKKLSGSTITWY